MAPRLRKAQSTPKRRSETKFAGMSVEYYGLSKRCSDICTQIKTYLYLNIYSNATWFQQSILLRGCKERLPRTSIRCINIPCSLFKTTIPLAFTVSRRIRIPERIVERIRIPIEALRIPRFRHERIRLQEPSQRGIVLPRAVVVKAQGGLLPLAGEAPIRGQARPCQSGPRHAIGIVASVAVRDFSPARVRGQAGRAEMVAVEVGQHAALTLGDALTAQIGRVSAWRRRCRACHFRVDSAIPSLSLYMVAHQIFAAETITKAIVHTTSPTNCNTEPSLRSSAVSAALHFVAPLYNSCPPPTPASAHTPYNRKMPLSHPHIA